MAPVQLALRLLIPGGSHLLELEEVAALAGPLDDEHLGHPWTHPDPRVDELQAQVQGLAERAEADGEPGARTFERIWRAAHAALGVDAPACEVQRGPPAPRHSESWYCCAEPTSRQLAAGTGATA